MVGDTADGSGLNRRLVLRSGMAAAAFAAAGALGVPEAALAKRKPTQKDLEEEEEFSDVPTISLKDFYTALADERVQNVEFDGPLYERCYVQLDGKKEYVLIGAGYPKESAINSSGPQQVLGKIKNEIKAGNQVTWSWRGAARFKKKVPGAEEEEVAPEEKKEAKKELTKEEKKTQRENREKRIKEERADQEDAANEARAKAKSDKQKKKAEKEKKEKEKREAPAPMTAEERALAEQGDEE